MIFLSTLLISVFITMALIPILRTAAVRLGNGLDLPDERKVHLKPVPKVGGIAMALGALLPVLVLADGSRFINSIMIGAWIVVLFGLADDLKNLDWKAKFAGQIAAALVVIFYGGLKIACLGNLLPDEACLPDWLAIPLTLIVIVGVTNAINLSDGLDGLAGGISLLIFICIGWLAYSGFFTPDRPTVMLLCMAVVGAIFGFLRFNTYPANIFMGDTGSQLLGFLAVTVSFKLTQHSATISPLVPLLVLGFPVLDTLTVMAQRIVEGRSPFSADKNHFHHKLMRLGLFHTEAVVIIYFLSTCLVTAGFLLRYHSDWLLIGVYLLFAGSVVAGFTMAERRGWTLKRQGFLDPYRGLKGWLRVLKDKAVVIRAAFFGLGSGLPLLLIFASLLPEEIPFYLGLQATGFIVLAAVCWLFFPKRLLSSLQLAIYFTVPLVLRMGQIGPAGWVHPAELQVYNLAFGVLAMATVLTLRYTRRTQGFKTSPMDFLILVVALVVPNLPDARIQGVQMGMLASHIIVLFYGFEVLAGELRGRLSRLAGTTLLALAIVAVRGFM